PLTPPLFPYTTLFRSGRVLRRRRALDLDDVDERAVVVRARDFFPVEDRGGRVEGRIGRVEVRRHAENAVDVARVVVHAVDVDAVDRKSTRLNSSHVSI